MKIDERIVIQMPPSMKKKNLRGRRYWTRRAAMRAAWAARNKILKETGRDIFNVFLMDDCAEITIKGDFDAMEAEE